MGTPQVSWNMRATCALSAAVRMRCRNSMTPYLAAAASKAASSDLLRQSRVQPCQHDDKCSAAATGASCREPQQATHKLLQKLLACVLCVETTKQEQGQVTQQTCQQHSTLMNTP